MKNVNPMQAAPIVVLFMLVTSASLVAQPLMVVNFRTRQRDDRVPAGIPQLAGWTPGVPRLGIPDLAMTDASLGITNPGNGRRNSDGALDSGTAFPAGLLIGSTFNAAAARQVGVALGQEARQRGFNVHLGGGINLVRD